MLNRNMTFNLQKRSTKLIITDEIIEKVPCTHIVDNGGKADKNIQKLHKELLRLSKNKNKSNEVGFLINLYDWSFEIVIGDGNRVSLSNNPNAEKLLKSSPKNTLMFMHNHPNNSRFSGQDLRMFSLFDSLYIATAISNNGNIYVMKKGPNFNGEALLIEYNKRVTEQKEFNMY